MEQNELNQNARGGTELMGQRLQQCVDNDLLRHFQIISSRVRDIDPDRKTILWLHDLPGDPEVQHLKNGGWGKFDKLVFVSHWQQQMYNAYLGVPYSAGVVIRNAIKPLELTGTRADDEIRIIYTSTPHRGLQVLYPVFDHLSKMHDNIFLDVFSSFELYGWKQRDEPFQELFDMLNAHDRITYHGAQPNEVVRKRLEEGDIFAYPSIWQETSCLSLIEAMSAGLTCVHSSLAALPETSLGLTMMYDYTEDMNEHANLFASVLNQAIGKYQKTYSGYVEKEFQKICTDRIYNTDVFGADWTNLLTDLIS